METLLDISGQVFVHKHPETGLLVTKSKSGKAFGYMVKSSQMVFETRPNGMTVQDIKTRAAFIVVPDKMLPINDGGTVKQMLLSDYFIAAGIVADGKVLPGQIVIKEQLVPFPKSDGSEGDPLLNIKKNPQTNENCEYLGKTVYRKSIYTANLNDKDELVHQWVERTGYNINRKSEQEEIEQWNNATERMLKEIQSEELMQEEFAV